MGIIPATESHVKEGERNGWEHVGDRARERGGKAGRKAH